MNFVFFNWRPTDGFYYCQMENEEASRVSQKKVDFVSKNFWRRRLETEDLKDLLQINFVNFI